MRSARMLAAALAAMSFSVPALGQQQTPGLPGQAARIAPDIYVGGSAGALFLNDVTVRSGGTLGGAPGTSSSKVGLKPGYAVTGLIGFQPSSYVAVEVEGGYASFGLENGTATAIHPDGTVSTGSTSGSGNALLGLASLIVSPLGVDRRFAPYIGVGGGVAALHASGTVGGLDFSTNGRRASPAVNAVAGLNFAVSDRIQIGVRYRYIWVNVQNSRFNDITGQSAALMAYYHF